MLHQFTWQQFLIAAFILTFSWYLAFILLYYRDNITRLFARNSKRKQPERLMREWEEDLEECAEEEQEQDLLGRPSLPEGVAEVGMDGFGFAHKEEKAEGIREAINEQEDNEIHADIDSQLRKELESVFKILEKEKGTKGDFISLFGLVSAKYPEIRTKPGRQAINDYLRENLPFEITDEELDKIWI